MGVHYIGLQTQSRAPAARAFDCSSVTGSIGTPAFVPAEYTIARLWELEGRQAAMSALVDCVTMNSPFGAVDRAATEPLAVKAGLNE